MQVILDDSKVYLKFSLAGMVGKQGVAALVSSQFWDIVQQCYICQLLHHCVNASLLLYLMTDNHKHSIIVQTDISTWHIPIPALASHKACMLL
jgi:hypothetical protein